MKEVREELAVPVDQEHLDMYTSLNKEQREGFDKILYCVMNKKSKCFWWMVQEEQERHSYIRHFLAECAQRD
jgi:hypothetical protein